MKMKSLILIFIALGCGLVATIGISQVMERSSGGGTEPLQMEQILVAKGDIDIGATLDANSVVLEEWPAAKVPEGAIRSLEEVDGNQYKKYLSNFGKIFDLRHGKSVFTRVSRSCRQKSRTRIVPPLTRFPMVIAHPRSKSTKTR